MQKTNQTMIYDSADRPPRPVEELIQIFRYRNLVLQLLRRNILARYKRSILGVAWTMINPLGTMLVLTIAFSKAFGSEIPGYPAYVLSGIVAWTFFSQTSYASIVDLVWGGQLLHRVYIPRTVFALAAIVTGLVNLCLALIPLLIVILVNGLPVRPEILFLPVPMLLLACFSLGIGLVLSTFAVYFPDVAEMYQIVLTAWMYLTAVFYPESILPDNLRVWVTTLNPMYSLVKMFRIPLYEMRLPALAEIWPVALFSIGVLVIGWWYFCLKSDEFAYRV